jgi:hypothetical protein
MRAPGWRRWLFLGLIGLGCGPKSVSMGEARHLEVIAFAPTQADPRVPASVISVPGYTVELHIADLAECLELSESARATFDGQPLALVERGGARTGHSGEDNRSFVTCLDAHFTMTRPAESSAPDAHVFTIEDDGRTITVEIPHYLTRPSVALSASSLYSGQTVTATWSPDDIELEGMNSVFGDCMNGEASFVQDGGSGVVAYCAPAINHRNTSEITVPPYLGFGAAQLFFGTFQYDAYYSPATPQLPVSRCEGAETCVATLLYFPNPVGINITAPPGDAGG